MSCGSLRARLLTAALIGASVMPILAQSGGAPAQTPPAQPPAGPDAAAAGTAGPDAAGPDAARARRRPARRAPAPPQPPAFRTGINFVRVDALVTDNKGNAIENLTQDDFEVYEDNKLQKVESFRYIKVEGNPLEGELPRQIRTTWDEETELARDDVRLFVIFYDDYHVRRGVGARRQAPAHRVHPQERRPDGHPRRHVPADAVLDHRLHAQPRGGDQGDRGAGTGGASTTGRATSSRSATPTIRPRSSSASATR